MTVQDHIATLKAKHAELEEAIKLERSRPLPNDLLLHDLGEGLAATVPEDGVEASEWRTAPLWGLGRVLQVQPLAGFLHDGRARTLEEAVLWHGGEAADARDRFVALSPEDRAALLRFLATR